MESDNSGCIYNSHLFSSVFPMKIQFFALDTAETAPRPSAGVSRLFSGHLGDKPAEPPALRPR